MNYVHIYFPNCMNSASCTNVDGGSLYLCDGSAVELVVWSVCSLSEDCIPYDDDGVGTVELE